MVAPTSFFSDYGGHIRILEEALSLQLRGHEVLITTYSQGDDLRELTIRRTARLPYHPDYQVGSSRHKIAFDIYLAVTTFLVGRKFRPDVIHGHMHEGALLGAPLARYLKVPLVFDFQGSLTAEMADHKFVRADGVRMRFFKWLEAFICSLPDATLTSSTRAVRLLESEFKIAPERISVLHDCVDVERFRPAVQDDDRRAELRATLGIAPENTVVAYLGLLADYQGIPDLIEAAVLVGQERNDIHFLVMGFPNEARWRAKAESAGVGHLMTFTGRIQYRNAPSYLSLGDIAISLKKSATEGSGKVLNYMAMAQPIVAYDNPVHREFLDELGLYVQPGDIAGVASAISSLADDPEQRHFLGNRLRERACSLFAWDRGGEQIEKLYRSLTDVT